MNTALNINSSYKPQPSSKNVSRQEQNCSDGSSPAKAPELDDICDFLPADEVQTFQKCLADVPKEASGAEAYPEQRVTVPSVDSENAIADPAAMLGLGLGAVGTFVGVVEGVGGMIAGGMIGLGTGLVLGAGLGTAMLATEQVSRLKDKSVLKKAQKKAAEDRANGKDYGEAWINPLTPKLKTDKAFMREHGIKGSEKEAHMEKVKGSIEAAVNEAMGYNLCP